MAAFDIGVPASLTRTASAEASEWTDSPCNGLRGYNQATNRNRSCWPLGIVERLIVDRDGIMRGAKLKAGKSFIERAEQQQLYPLELSCDRSPPPKIKLPGY